MTLEVRWTLAESATVTAGSAPGLESTPASGLSLVTARDLHARAPANLAQALENVAGASTVSEGQAAVPALRALARGRTPILIDGARVTAERRVGPSATYLDPVSIEAVEVSRGPGSVAYGSDAFGGVQHVRTGAPSRVSPWAAASKAAWAPAHLSSGPPRALEGLRARRRAGAGALSRSGGKSPEGEVFNSGARGGGAGPRRPDGQEVKQGQLLVEWDPYSFTILTEDEGEISFKDVIDGQTVHEQVDENTGMSALVIMETPDEKKQPRIEIKDSKGKTTKRYLLPSGAHLMVEEGAEVAAGDVLAKIPRETAKTKDITGGLPRVVELFEARRPKEPAVITEIDGQMRYGDVAKQHRKIFVTGDDEQPREYQLPRGAHISVQEGERVRAGEALMEGPIDPHDILRVKGEKELQRYLVDEIQEVYRLQGVNINDKHIEVITRQMMRWVKVEDVGDTEFLIDEVVDKFRFMADNERLIAAGKKPASGHPLLLGITKASLSTDSFISAASFQETTRVLTEAAISGKVDHLRGLKENVIMGRLIPAGTGMEFYRRIKIPDEVVERPESGLEGGYEAEYLVEPEHIKEGLEV